MTNNTPIDEYYFWKNLIKEKKDAGEAVSSDMCELLMMAEAKMTHFLAKYVFDEEARRVEYRESLLVEYNNKAEKDLSKVPDKSTQTTQDN